MLDMKRREFIALACGGGLLVAAKVRRARAQQPAMPVIGFMRADTPKTRALEPGSGSQARAWRELTKAGRAALGLVPACLLRVFGRRERM
jgi:hypothetical protein